jgi:putative transcriptional regulator
MGYMGKVRWRLSDLMVEHGIRGVDLADYLKVSNNTVSTWKNAPVMPCIGNERWIEITQAINNLSKKGSITPMDLIEYIPTVPGDAIADTSLVEKKDKLSLMNLYN